MSFEEVSDDHGGRLMSTRRRAYVGLSAGCYPELALATAVPGGKCLG